MRKLIGDWNRLLDVNFSFFFCGHGRHSEVLWFGTLRTQGCVRRTLPEHNVDSETMMAVVPSQNQSSSGVTKCFPVSRTFYRKSPGAFVVRSCVSFRWFDNPVVWIFIKLNFSRVTFVSSFRLIRKICGRQAFAPPLFLSGVLWRDAVSNCRPAPCSCFDSIAIFIPTVKFHRLLLSALSSRTWN